MIATVSRDWNGPLPRVEVIASAQGRRRWLTAEPGGHFWSRMRLPMRGAAGNRDCPKSRLVWHWDNGIEVGQAFNRGEFEQSQ
jgi:hypothetical protein